MHSTGNRQRGFIITLEVVLLLTIVVIGLLVGVIAVRNALFQLATARAQFELVVKDADDPPLRVEPIGFDLCEAPQILCRDLGFDEVNNGMAATPGPSAGLFALVGIRATHLVSRNRIYYSGAGCTGTTYLAPPAVPDPPETPGVFPPELPVGYFNCALQVDAGGDRVCYGVGPPSNWPCTPLDDTAGAGCADGGRLYRSVGTTVAAQAVASQWVSLNPDCADLGSAAATGAICDDFGPLTLDLLPAVAVTEMDGTNVLAPFTPLFNSMAPAVSAVTVTPAAEEGAPLATGGSPITETGQPDIEPAGDEGEPPP